MNGQVGYNRWDIFFEEEPSMKHEKQIESDKWFNPDFEKFLNKEIAPEPESKPI